MSNDFSAQLQARFQGTQPRNDSPEPSDVYGKLTQLISKVTGVTEGLERDARFEDLGVASLDFIELTVRAEDEFKVRLEEETMAEISTIGELVNYVEEHQ
ncbi:acyl carrier protein [Corynebacterium flavescens]|uniref:acyl carrier protein n=1 Tax=Corynebacterium flavescens TaxID=28028 RepID=UPI0026472C37|nr:acyl carrier protein [Corynebacterium flavescens]MDN6198847.1 acyl carrier protein [Corynebacterium flavescens]